MNWKKAIGIYGLSILILGVASFLVAVVAFMVSDRHEVDIVTYMMFLFAIFGGLGITSSQSFLHIPVTQFMTVTIAKKDGSKPLRIRLTDFKTSSQALEMAFKSFQERGV